MNISSVLSLAAFVAFAPFDDGKAVAVGAAVAADDAAHVGHAVAAAAVSVVVAVATATAAVAAAAEPVAYVADAVAAAVADFPFVLLRLWHV